MKRLMVCAVIQLFLVYFPYFQTLQMVVFKHH